MSYLTLQVTFAFQLKNAHEIDLLIGRTSY